MSKSLAELRAKPPKARAARSLNICLAPHLVAEVQELTAELAALEEKSSGRSGTGNRPRRGGEGENPRSTEIRARLAELLEEMTEFEGELRVEATREDGEWRRWVDEHPAREEGQPGYDRDLRYTKLICNTDDLIEDLGTYVFAWNGDELADGDYAAIFESNISGGDKRALAEAVTAMYESRLDFQQWRSRLSANLTRSPDSASPSTSGSPTSDSTDGNPEPSNGATTPRAARAR